MNYLNTFLKVFLKINFKMAIDTTMICFRLEISTELFNMIDIGTLSTNHENKTEMSSFIIINHIVVQ